MILLVAQLILQNCPTFIMIWRPLETAPPGVAGAPVASLRHCVYNGDKRLVTIVWIFQFDSILEFNKCQADMRVWRWGRLSVGHLFEFPLASGLQIPGSASNPHHHLGPFLPWLHQAQFPHELGAWLVIALAESFSSNKLPHFFSIHVSVNWPLLCIWFGLSPIASI